MERRNGGKEEGREEVFEISYRTFLLSEQAQ